MGPFLRYEGGRTREGGVGQEREHVDSMDVFSVGAEVGGCIHFIFEELNWIRGVSACLSTTLGGRDNDWWTTLNGRKKKKKKKKKGKGGKLTTPATLFAMNSAG